MGSREKSYGNFDFIGVELSLDGSESSQLSKLHEKKKKEKETSRKKKYNRRYLWHMCIKTIYG